MEYLVGESYGGRGPWSHNSSGALHNVAKIAECDGVREAIHLYKNVLVCFEKDDATVAAESAAREADRKAKEDVHKAQKVAEEQGKSMKKGDAREVDAGDISSGEYTVTVQRPTGKLFYNLLVQDSDAVLSRIG